MSVALVHDYLTQRGGAERVVLSLARAFPEAPLYTSLYDPAATFPEFGDADVRPSPLNRIAALRRSHRLALPLLPQMFSRLTVDCDVAICSSSGWAHGAHVTGRKIVYCHTPARWLYQPDRYAGASSSLGRVALSAMHGPLVRWDKRAAASATCYIAVSSVIRERIRATYERDAEIVPPPHAMDPAAPQTPVENISPGGYALCIARLLPYKNVDAVVAAFAELKDLQLVVVGSGPAEERIRAAAPRNVTFLRVVDDNQLRWLYAHAIGLIAASYEDFGLTPIEAAAFGKPAAVLRWGGFLDTMREGETGVFFDAPEARHVARAIRALRDTTWDPDTLRAHADGFAEHSFIDRMRSAVAGAGA